MALDWLSVAVGLVLGLAFAAAVLYFASPPKSHPVATTAAALPAERKGSEGKTAAVDGVGTAPVDSNDAASHVIRAAKSKGAGDGWISIGTKDGCSMFKKETGGAVPIVMGSIRLKANIRVPIPALISAHAASSASARGHHRTDAVPSSKAWQLHRTMDRRRM